MKKVCIFILAMMLTLPLLIGQQLPLLQQQIEHRNPAFIPANFQKYNYSTQASIGYRTQWVELEDAPRTLSGDFTNWSEEFNLLFGGNIIHDETGPTQFTGLSGKIGYGIQISNDWLLTAALKGGVVQYRIHGDKLDFLDPGDFTESGTSKLYPDLSLGSMLYFKEKYYAGFSIPQIFGLNLGFKEETGNYNIQRARHYYGIAGARFELFEASWLDVSSEVQFLPEAPIYFSGNVAFDFREIFWTTASYSTANHLRFGGGIFGNLGGNWLSVGYIFSHFFQNYGPFFGGTHELRVSYSWN